MQENSAVTPKSLAKWLAEFPEFANSNAWGIGGSCLLQQLGLVAVARDLDIVCTEAEFLQLSSALAGKLTQVQVSPHPQFCSHYFARFLHASGIEIELMAGIQVQQAADRICWTFHPEHIWFDEQLPWMSALQWLELYRLFNRPSSADLLLGYCQSRGITVD
jgi:hypothetical protein